MTAEPVCHEIALSNHMKVTLEYDPDGSRTAILWNEANEPIADGDAPVIASPAVQPAAGREEIARLAIDFVTEQSEGEWGDDLIKRDADKLTARILAALAHPPAQASESGGEAIVFLQKLERHLVAGGDQGDPVEGRMLRHEMNALLERYEAALSAPQVAPACFAENANQESVTRQLAEQLATSIAGLGYPVGMGKAPTEEHCMKAAQGILDLYAEPDPRVTEWGYSSTDEALTHLGQLLEDQAAFDGLAAPGEGEGES